MDLLQSFEVLPFCDGIKHRIFVDEDIDLLPVYGSLLMNGKICCSWIYTNNKDPFKVSAILIKSMPVTQTNVDQRFSANSDDVEQLHNNWVKIMDAGEGQHNTSIVLMWMDPSHIKTEAAVYFHDYFKIKLNLEILASQSSIIDSFMKVSGHQFQHAASAHIAYLKGNKNDQRSPEGYTIKLLSKADAMLAIGNWKFHSPDRSARYRLLLSAGISIAVGAYHNETGSLVSWIFSNADSAMSGLGTIKEHQGKGLAKAVISKMCDIYQQKGLVPFAYIQHGVDSSHISEALFTKIGFECIKTKLLSWAHVIG